MPSIDNMGTYSVGVGVYTIRKADGLRTICFKLSNGGAATITGTVNTAVFGASAAIPMVPLEPTFANNQDPIDGLVLTVTLGTVTIITGQ